VRTIVRLADLPHPVSAVKGHWNPVFPETATTMDGWVGFTPSRDDPESRQQLRSTVSRQMANGYVVEYVSISLPPPNIGGRPLTEDEKALHQRSAGALTAVFKLANRPANARALIGLAQYEDLQTRWDQRGDHVRWSEAFPIIEAWNITGWPTARNALGLEAAARCCERQSQVLKVLDDDDRAKLANLDLTPIDLAPDGLAARYFTDIAVMDNESKGVSSAGLTAEDRPLFKDYAAIEGISKDMRVRIALRDRHLVAIRKTIGPLECALCHYTPIGRGATKRQARAMLDAHHKTPVRAGERLSRVTDLTLLCPTCHREVHQGMLVIPISD
jgi:5-methylcytosine-specific restriction protein A